MEVKIKQGANLIEATIEMVDGVMVVSPKVDKYVPKDGDVVYSGGFYDFVFIYKENLTAEAYYYVYLCLKDNKIELPDGGHIGYVSQLRPATEEEKKKLFAKLKEEGYEFDFEKKELIKLKWKPKVGDEYYHPSCSITNDGIRFDLAFATNTAVSFDMKILKHNLAFKTKEECQEFCNRLNDAINSVKP